MAISIRGNNGIVVNASTSYDLQTNLTTDMANAGFGVAAAEVHDGSTGATRLVRASDASVDYRTRMGIDTILWNDVYTYTSLNNTRYKLTENTMTKAIATGAIVFNNGNSVAAANANVQTWRTFPLYGETALYVDVWARITQQPTANNVCEWGLGYVAAATAPTDGIYFRLNGAAEFVGCVNSNGTEVQVSLTKTWALNTAYHFLIVIANDRCEFWCDDIMLGAIPTPDALGGPSFSGTAPLFFREYNTGATAVAQQLQIVAATIMQADVASSRLWETAMAGIGNNCVNTPIGASASWTQNFGLSTAPVNSTCTNTAAGYATLGGQFSFLQTTASEVDLILFGYPIPAGSATIPGQNLVIRGVRIDAVNTSTLPSTYSLFQFGLSVGGTAVSLATVDSSAAGTRAGRKIDLGFLGGFTTAQALFTAGAYNSLSVTFDAPVYCEPGTYLNVIYKVISGSSSVANYLRGNCFINGYWE